MSPAARPLMLALDLGTSGVRATLFDDEGRLAGAGDAAFPTRSPNRGWAEQDPEQWWSALVTACRQVVAGDGRAHPRGDGGDRRFDRENRGDSLRDRIVGLSITGQMAGLVVTDSSGRPLRPATTWMDGRGAAVLERLEAVWGSRELYERTGCPLRPYYPLAQLVWLRERSRRMDDISRCLSPKDYVYYRLTGCFVTDPSTAGATQLYNVRKGAWDGEILSWLGLPEAALPAIGESTDIRPLAKDAAEQLGLSPSLPVVVGAGDGVCANVGVGAFRVGTIGCNVGTSAAVRVVTSGPTPDTRMRTALYPFLGDFWISNGATNNGGAAVQWFARSFYPDDGPASGSPSPGRVVFADGAKTGRASKTYTTSKTRVSIDRMLAEAATVAPGADGLLAAPYVFGDRHPDVIKPGQGMFHGVGMGHGRRHFARALLEGTVFIIATLLDVLRETMPVADIAVGGGLARSPLYRQILADVSGLSVRHGDQGDSATALGAAAVGFLGLGRFGTFEEAVNNLVRAEDVTAPDPRTGNRYKEAYERFLQVRSFVVDAK